MVGNVSILSSRPSSADNQTYSYTPAIWADDIAKASANGIDGFALNMGRDEWEPARIADAYAAAEAKGNFKLFL
jgi:glucan endo-1,3-alpha-glucosidase